MLRSLHAACTNLQTRHFRRAGFSFSPGAVSTLDATGSPARPRRLGSGLRTPAHFVRSGAPSDNQHVATHAATSFGRSALRRAGTVTTELRSPVASGPESAASALVLDPDRCSARHSNRPRRARRSNLARRSTWCSDLARHSAWCSIFAWRSARRADRELAHVDDRTYPACASRSFTPDSHAVQGWHRPAQSALRQRRHHGPGTTHRARRSSGSRLACSHA